MFCDVRFYRLLTECPEKGLTNLPGEERKEVILILTLLFLPVQRLSIVGVFDSASRLFETFIAHSYCKLKTRGLLVPCPTLSI